MRRKMPSKYRSLWRSPLSSFEQPPLSSDGPLSSKQHQAPKKTKRTKRKKRKKREKKREKKGKKKEKKVWWPCKRLACSPSLRLCHLHHDQKGQMPPASPAALPQKTCFLYFFYSFTTLPWTCAHLQLKSSQESQILSQFPLCSSRWLSMLTHSIWPGPHLPCKQQTTDYLRWLWLWFCGRCRNNVAPKWHAIFIQRDHGCPLIMKVSRQFQWEHMNFCNKI